jgi:hypothetical protein
MKKAIVQFFRPESTCYSYEKRADDVLAFRNMDFGNSPQVPHVHSHSVDFPVNTINPGRLSPENGSLNFKPARVPRFLYHEILVQISWY